MKTITMLLFFLIVVSIWISPALPQGATIHSTRAAFTNLQNPASSALLGQPISQEANKVLGQYQTTPNQATSASPEQIISQGANAVLGQHQANSGSQPTALTLSFDHYTIKYYANPELDAQIDCYSGSSKVGEIGFYSGNSGFVNQIFNNQILIFYPISQFPDIMNMLRYTKGPLNLQMSYEVLKSGETWLESGEMQQVGAA